MKIKYTALALALAVSAATVNANVELKSSDDDQLLVNGAAAQLVPHVYDASGEVVDELTVITPDAFNPTVVLNLGNEKIHFVLGANGEFTYQDRDDMNEIVAEGCIDKIGLPYDRLPLINITATVLSHYSDDPLAFPAPAVVYEIGQNIVEGYEVESCHDSSPSTIVKGLSITPSPGLTAALEEFMNSLETPLTIK